MHLIVGLFLSGCTFTAYQPNHYNADFTLTKSDTLLITYPSDLSSKEVISETIKVVEPVRVDKKTPHLECSVYVPIKFPVLIKIDFVQLEKAQTTKEINAILLKNIGDVRKQMIQYDEQQKKHYAEYVKRCVVK